MFFEPLKNYLITNLLFDPQKPLLFTQAFFWVFFLFVLLGYSVAYRNKTARNTYLLAVSLYFYYKCGGALIWLLIFSIVITWAIGLAMARSRTQTIRKLWVALSVVCSLGILAYFKYTFFFIGIWNQLFGAKLQAIDYMAQTTNRLLGSHFDITAIILPVGISFFTFQALSYIVDLYRGHTQVVRNLIDFGFYKSFFPQLVAGPIVRAAGFVPQLYAQYSLSNREMSHAVFLILNGLVKKMVVSDFISLNFVDRVFDSPLSYSEFENLMAVYGYTLQIYCDFSGYTDIAIGLALLLGFRLPQNFNSPYKASSLTEFWRRWHISLSSWLRDYLYKPLGGNRKGKIRTSLNLLITMLLGGLWHGASLRFVIWGGLHGIGLLIERMLGIGKPYTSRILRFVGVFLTFQFVALAWVFFRAQDTALALQILNRIAGTWNIALIPTMAWAYSKIFTIIVLAFAIHWLPARFKERYRGWFVALPIYIKLIVCVLVALFIFQFQTSALQPFIYFQF